MKPISHRWRRYLGLALVAFAALTVIAPALADKPKEALEGPIRASVSAIPLNFDRDKPERNEFGKLVFLGGLNLFAKSHHFGGYSGLALDPTGTTLLAVSDAGTWMRATLDYDGRKLKDLVDVVMGPILGKDGRPLKSDAERDAEGLVLAGADIRNGSAYVSFEREQGVLRYPFSADRFGPPNGTVSLPGEAKRMEANQGIEAIAVVSAGRFKGTLLAFSERLKDQNGNLQGWLIGGPSPGLITVKRLGGFDITDAAPLPDGDIVLLERRFRYSEGIKMRLRRIAASELKRGTLFSGEVLLEAHDNLNIDNMEAIATHRRPSGETVITLMSDDNFSPFQRTLIMQFALPERPVVAGPH